MNSLAAERVQVPPSPGWLAPIEVDDLLRVGGNNDGGYVLPGALLRDADVLIPMGRQDSQSVDIPTVFALIHVHANDFTPFYRDGFPEALELTLERRDLVRGKRRRKELPLPKLDRPNDPGRPDYRLMFP